MNVAAVAGGEAGTAGLPYSLIASSVGSAVIGSVLRFGTAMINTDGWYTSVITSLPEPRNALRHI